MVKCEITIEYFVLFELRFFSLCGIKKTFRDCAERR